MARKSPPQHRHLHDPRPYELLDYLEDNQYRRRILPKYSEWTDVVGTNISQSVYESTLRDGGVSINLDGKRPQIGYVISLPDSELTVPLDDFSPDIIDTYVDQHREELTQPDIYLGTWIRDGQAYIDVSTIEQDYDTAFQLGKQYNQIAIHDLSTGDDIPINQESEMSIMSALDHQGVINANAGTDLQGLPGQVKVPGYGPLQFHSNADLQRLAGEYNQTNGLGQHPQDYRKVNPELASRVAEAYEQVEHNPDDPQVRAAYDALIKETQAQYEHLANNGYQFEFYPQGENPYPNSPREAVLDLLHNKHMYVYPTAAGYGMDENPTDHPMLQQTPYQWGGQPVYANDLFRAVHDVYGHAKEGLGFRGDGEDNAYRQHSAMFSPQAQQALANETRGQNSWVNYGKYGQHNQNASQSDTIYAPQKAGILPSWASDPELHANDLFSQGQGISQDRVYPSGGSNGVASSLTSTSMKRIHIDVPDEPYYYHVAPSRVRESIQSQGVVPHDPRQGGWHPTQLSPDVPNGVFAFPRLHDAQYFKRNAEKARKEPHDIWGLPRDAGWQPEPESEYHPGNPSYVESTVPNPVLIEDGLNPPTTSSVKTSVADMPWGQTWDEWQAMKPDYTHGDGHKLGYDPTIHSEGKGFILNDGSVWTWPTQNLRPAHMDYSFWGRNQGGGVKPGTPFHIDNGRIWQYGEGRDLPKGDRHIVRDADPRLDPYSWFNSGSQQPEVQTDNYGHADKLLNLVGCVVCHDLPYDACPGCTRIAALSEFDDDWQDDLDGYLNNYEVYPWQRGNHGKFLVTPQGEFVHWQTNDYGEPHHDSVGSEWGKQQALKGDIAPNGAWWVTDTYHNNPSGLLNQVTPQAQRAGLAPSVRGYVAKKLDICTDCMKPFEECQCKGGWVDNYPTDQLRDLKPEFGGTS